MIVIKVLFVDDEKKLTDMAKLSLGTYGFEVTIATNASEAIACVRDGFHPHILCTDIVMPGGSGVKLARDLIELLPNLKVLLITGNDEQVMGTNMRDGFEVMGKPYLFSTLARKLRQMMPLQD